MGYRVQDRLHGARGPHDHGHRHARRPDVDRGDHEHVRHVRLGRAALRPGLRHGERRGNRHASAACGREHLRSANRGSGRILDVGAGREPHDRDPLGYNIGIIDVVVDLIVEHLDDDRTRADHRTAVERGRRRRDRVAADGRHRRIRAAQRAQRRDRRPDPARDRVRAPAAGGAPPAGPARRSPAQPRGQDAQRWAHRRRRPLPAGRPRRSAGRVARAAPSRRRSARPVAIR